MTRDDGPPPLVWSEGDEAHAPADDGEMPPITGPRGPRLASDTLDEIEEALGYARPKPEALVWQGLTKKLVGPKDDKREVVLATPRNAEVVLRHDTRWVGKLRRNAFTGEVIMETPGHGPEVMSDVTCTRAVAWIEFVYGFVVSEDRVMKTVAMVAEDHQFHPVREYLDSLEWDGEPRIDGLLSGYFGARDTELTRMLSRCWMISAIARAREPGCKVDTTLVLVGRQGARKSTACRVLAGEWYSDTDLDLKSKDLYESIAGVWIYEMAEIDSYRSKADRSHVKRIMSSMVDRYRRPYGRGAESRPRQVVFIGSTNEDHFLDDVTGARRFWPVRVARIDIDALKRDRDQLWAEADRLHRDGHDWWLDETRARALAVEADKFHVRLPWYELISEWVIGRADGFTTSKVLTDCISKEKGQWSPRDTQQVAACLKLLGFEQADRKDNRRLWVRSVAESGSAENA